MFLFQKCFLKSAVVLAVMIFACSAVSSGTINVHWTPTSGGGVAHGTTVSGKLMINLIEPCDGDPMTTQSMAFVEGYIQEVAHEAPQVPLSPMTGTTTCASCSGSNQMVISSTSDIALDHNATYRVYIKGRVTGFRMMPPGPLQPYDVTPAILEITNNNLHYTSSTLGVMPWDPATMSSINFGSAYDDAQTGTCRSTYEIYSTGGSLVYTKQPTGDLDRPGDDDWDWNGLDSFGFAAPKGLYVMKCNVIANAPTMTRDDNRSGYLSIQDPTGGGIEYYGYDDNGTPADTSDDNYLYYIKCYKLVDTGNLNASEGEICLWDPDLQNLISWDIEDLYCRTHSSCDGLHASSAGIQHDVLLEVPIACITSDGIYKFVVSVKDSHANNYRTHENRWALDRNGAYSPKVKIEVDGDTNFIPTTTNTTQVTIKIVNEAGATLTQSKMPITINVTPSHMRSTSCNYEEQASEKYSYGGSSNKPKADFVWQSLGGTSIQPDRTQYNDSFSQTIYSSLDTNRPQGAITYSNGTCTMTLASYDYGGRMKIEVTPPASRTDVKVEYKDDPTQNKTMTYMWVPWDYDNDRIADKWEINEAGNITTWAFNTDNDNIPNTPSSNTGDGYYAFEEYRGFITNGSHIRTDPHRKDLYVRSSLGLGNIVNATGFDVHAVTDSNETEMNDYALMTSNCYVTPDGEWGGSVPHVDIHSQKGLRVVEDTSAQDAPLGSAPWGTPNSGGILTIYTTAIQRWVNRGSGRSYNAALNMIITHEAGHSICLAVTPSSHHIPITFDCAMQAEVTDISVNQITYCQDCNNRKQLH